MALKDYSDKEAVRSRGQDLVSTHPYVFSPPVFFSPSCVVVTQIRSRIYSRLFFYPPPFPAAVRAPHFYDENVALFFPRRLASNSAVVPTPRINRRSHQSNLRNASKIATGMNQAAYPCKF